uniref:Uncharacterized protein n=1 Tax=Cacopsylla melanoneura TaxID=428564 RepID=A0A8D8U268_9HEMI
MIPNQRQCRIAPHMESTQLVFLVEPIFTVFGHVVLTAANVTSRIGTSLGPVTTIITGPISPLVFVPASSVTVGCVLIITTVFTVTIVIIIVVVIIILSVLWTLLVHVSVIYVQISHIVHHLNLIYVRCNILYLRIVRRYGDRIEMTARFTHERSLFVGLKFCEKSSIFKVNQGFLKTLEGRSVSFPHH